ncbi:hypothetical protein HZS54_25945 [Halosimplex pelagicum]|uniref:DUF6199 domain-containing protein n=1 Tax=Halosimplex pelagicum TaxID=869886 RepID=A0A7D5T7Z7_9EURY|nr:hypothetical protein HZS54_25945 [Halosimplex pelagicum]
MFLGFLFAVFGGLGVRYARPLARFNEQMDAIGSTTPASEVEPAEWNVTFTKLLSACFLLLGLGLIVAGVL